MFLPPASPPQNCNRQQTGTCCSCCNLIFLHACDKTYNFYKGCFFSCSNRTFCFPLFFFPFLFFLSALKLQKRIDKVASHAVPVVLQVVLELRRKRGWKLSKNRWRPTIGVHICCGVQWPVKLNPSQKAYLLKRHIKAGLDSLYFWTFVQFLKDYIFIEGIYDQAGREMGMICLIWSVISVWQRFFLIWVLFFRFGLVREGHKIFRWDLYL